MSQKLKIAFGCQSGVGKSTATNWLCKKYGGKDIAFSDSLYNILYYTQDICGFERKKDRMFLQMLGSWARAHDPEVWINKLDLDLDENIFISDVRFLNEFDTLKKKGFVMIRILNNNSPKNNFGNGAITHESETSLISKSYEEWDYVIDNHGTIDKFYENLENLIEKILNSEQ